MVCKNELPIKSACESLLNLLDYCDMLCYECNTLGKMMSIRVRIIVIASGIIVLASLPEESEERRMWTISQFWPLTSLVLQ